MQAITMELKGKKNVGVELAVRVKATRGLRQVHDYDTYYNTSSSMPLLASFKPLINHA